MNIKNHSFLDHLLRRRLNRVPPEWLKKFLEQQSIDVRQLKTKNALLDTLINHYEIMKNNIDFNHSLNNFLRDFVLSAGVSEYIIQVANVNDVFRWIANWKENTYLGQKYKFEIHTVRDLEQKFLRFEEDASGNINASLEEDSEIEKMNQKDRENIISLPSGIIFLVASSLEEVYELNGLEQIARRKTFEFEIICRQNINLMEVRGDYQVIKDFVATAVTDGDNPLSMAASLFIGEEEDLRNSLVTPLRRRIGIDTLKNEIDGFYLSIASLVDGTKASRIKIDLDELKDWNEETEPLLKALLEKVQKTLDKGRISFHYKSKKYSFLVTKTGGLRFFEYVPEEVVTYILYAINKAP